MAIELTEATRHAVAKALFNSITILSFWGKQASPDAIQAQIDECNAALRKLGCHELVDGMPERRLPQSILDEL